MKLKIYLSLILFFSSAHSLGIDGNRVNTGGLCSLNRLKGGTVIYGGSLVTKDTFRTIAKSYTGLDYNGITIDDCDKRAANNNSLYITFTVASSPIVLDAVKTYIDPSKDMRETEDEEKLLNARFPVQSFNARKENIVQQHKFLTHCLERKITSNLPLILDKPPSDFNLPQCELEIISDREVIMNTTADCFFHIGKGAKFQIKSKFKKSCLNEKFLSKNNFAPIEFIFYTSVRIINNPKNVATPGEIGQETILMGSIPGRLHLESSQKPEILAREIRNRPIYIKEYYTPEVEMGVLEIQDLGEKGTKVKASIAVNNVCPKVCRNGICTSNCSFLKPLAAEIIFYKISELGEKIPSKSPWTWRMGRILSPQWQGIIKISKIFKDLKIEKEQKYGLAISFRNPKTDYWRFKQNNIIIPVNLIDKNRSFNSLMEDGLQEIPTVPETNKIEEIQKINRFKVGASYTIPSSFKNGSSLGANRNYIWPNYKKVCYKNNKSCTSVQRYHPYIRLLVELKALKKREFTEQDILWELDFLTVRRESRLLEDYERSIQSVCDLPRKNRTEFYDYLFFSNNEKQICEKNTK